MLIARRTIIALELIVGLLAVAGGIALIAQPSGKVLGFDVAALNGVFKSYLWPGVVLVAMGALQFIAAWATHMRFMWDHVVSTAAGATLILWIAVQVVIIGFTDWTQPVFFLIGNVVFYLATELWREGESLHLGMVDGYENLDTRGRHAVSPEWRRSDRWRVLQLFMRRGT